MVVSAIFIWLYLCLPVSDHQSLSFKRGGPIRFQINSIPQFSGLSETGVDWIGGRKGGLVSKTQQSFASLGLANKGELKIRSQQENQEADKTNQQKSDKKPERGCSCQSCQSQSHPGRKPWSCKRPDSIFTKYICENEQVVWNN